MELITDAPDDLVLPKLREELQILPGSPLLGGAPSWMIFDPVQSRFYQVSIEIFQLLSLWSVGSMSALIDSVTAKFGRQVNEDEVENTIKFLGNNSLTLYPLSGPYTNYLQQKLATRRSVTQSLIHNYLFFRIPLVRPEAFLRRTVGRIEFLFSKWIVVVVLLLTLSGLYLVSRQWDVFLGQFQYFFNVQGIAFYGVCLVAIKILHELGHAYTATRYGSRVSTMGLAFLVMIPVLYTDTTDAWRLKAWRQRAHIDSAGMIVEFAVAGLATLLWVFLADGPLRSAVFALATTSWALSLLVNLNPFMRFDGYHLLVDLLGIQNLQTRSFSLAKWRLREFLFGLGESAPEPAHSYRGWMTFYGYSVWVYRFFLFLGIAFLVYALFFKVLGVFLFFVEIFWFIAFPVLSEVKVWWQKKSQIVRSGRSKLTLVFVTLFLIAMFAPWSGAVYVPAVLAAEKVNTLYPQRDAVVTQIKFHPGMRVAMGDLLVGLQSPVLDYEVQKTMLEIALLEARQSRRTVDLEDRGQSIVLQQQLNAAKERLTGQQSQLQELQIEAPFDGIVTDIDDTLHLGQSVNERMALGTLVNTSDLGVRGYVDEQALRRVGQGQTGRFVPDDATRPSVDVQLTRIAPASSVAPDLPYVASVYGGNIPAYQNDKGEIVPTRSTYLLEFELADELSSPMQTIPGEVKLEAKKESLALRLWRSIARVGVREIGA